MVLLKGLQMVLKRDCVGAEAFEVAILGGLIFCASIVAVSFIAPNISKIFLADSSPVKVTTTSFGVKSTSFDNTLPSKKLIASAHNDLSIKANKNTFPERPKYPSNVVVKNVYSEPAKVHPANVRYYSQVANNNYSPSEVSNNYDTYYDPNAVSSDSSIVSSDSYVNVPHKNATAVAYGHKSSSSAAPSNIYRPTSGPTASDISKRNNNIPIISGLVANSGFSSSSGSSKSSSPSASSSVGQGFLNILKSFGVNF